MTLSSHYPVKPATVHRQQTTDIMPQLPLPLTTSLLPHHNLHDVTLTASAKSGFSYHSEAEDVNLSPDSETDGSCQSDLRQKYPL